MKLLFLSVVGSPDYCIWIVDVLSIHFSSNRLKSAAATWRRWLR
jgi:hypothetical protein